MVQSSLTLQLGQIITLASTIFFFEHVAAFLAGGVRDGVVGDRRGPHPVELVRARAPFALSVPPFLEQLHRVCHAGLVAGGFVFELSPGCARRLCTCSFLSSLILAWRGCWRLCTLVASPPGQPWALCFFLPLSATPFPPAK